METVFVGNLSYFCTNAALVDFFAPLGPVHGVNVRRSKKNIPLHYGFVEMPREMAFLASNQLNGKEFMGRKIRISIRKGISDEATPQSMYHSLHMSFLTTTISEQINEIYLTKIFSKYGGLEDCVVKSHMDSKRNHKQGGYAFLYFKDLASAENVLRIVKKCGGIIDGVMYDAKFSCTSLSVNTAEAAEEENRPSLDASTDSEGLIDSPQPALSPEAHTSMKMGNWPNLRVYTQPGVPMPMDNSGSPNSLYGRSFSSGTLHNASQPAPMMMPMPQFAMPNGKMYQMVMPSSSYSSASSPTTVSGVHHSSMSSYGGVSPSLPPVMMPGSMGMQMQYFPAPPMMHPMMMQQSTQQLQQPMPMPYPMPMMMFNAPSPTQMYQQQPQQPLYA